MWRPRSSARRHPFLRLPLEETGRSWGLGCGGVQPPGRTYGPQAGACTPTAFANGVLPATVSAAFNALRSAPLSARHAATDFPRSLHADLWAASITAVGAICLLYTSDAADERSSV